MRMRVYLGEPPGAREDFDPARATPLGPDFDAAQEISLGDDADELAAIDHREPAHLILQHQFRRLLHHPAGHCIGYFHESLTHNWGAIIGERGDG
jgi:hypothetical protein